MQDIVVGKDRVSLAELIGKGGEGEVFAIKGRGGQAVKIYNARLRAKREDKVRAMVREGLASKTDLVAYGQPRERGAPVGCNKALTPAQVSRTYPCFRPC